VQGFGATGIKQIIDEAGIAKGTFYTHFQSKDELGLAWLKLRHITWNRWFEESMQDTQGAEMILHTFDFLEKWLQENDYRGCAFVNSMAEIPCCENPMRKEVEAHKLGLLERFQELVCEHYQSLRKSEAIAIENAKIIYLLFEGALVESQNFHQVWPVHSARKKVAELLEA
jgi:AcrR family transcriptional regulator